MLNITQSSILFYQLHGFIPFFVSSLPFFFPFTKVAPIESAGAVSQPVNSTAADSQTTSTSETPSSGVNGDRQPVATQHESKETQGTGSEEKKDSVEDTSVSKEVAEILAAWPKVMKDHVTCLDPLSSYLKMTRLRTVPL